MPVYESWFKWSDFVVVSQFELDQYEEGTILTMRPGSLIRARNEAAVYVIEGANRHPIDSVASFNSLGYDWESVVVVPAGEPDKYSLLDKPSVGGAHLDGTVIKSNSSAAVYLLEGGKKRVIPSVQVFDSRFKWQDLIVTNDQEMNLYAEGARLGFRPGSLVKSSVSPAVWVITDSTKRAISSVASFHRLDYNWSTIILTTEAELNNYTTGEVL
jgi:hypothetical protein